MEEMYDEFGNYKDELWYEIDKIEKSHYDFDTLRKIICDSELSYVENNKKLNRLIENAILSFMNENNIDEKYYEEILSNFKYYYDSFEYYYNTRDNREKIDENSIIITEADIEEAKKYIKRGIICCAHEIGEYLLKGEFECDLSIERLTELAEHPYENQIHGVPLDSSLVSLFVNNLTNKLLNKLEEKGISKQTVISVLGVERFIDTTQKKLVSYGIDSFSIAAIDNDPDAIIQECLHEINLNNVHFSKNANKRSFRIKNGEFGRTSMNTGHWIPMQNIDSDERVIDFISQKQIVSDNMTESHSNIIR